MNPIKIFLNLSFLIITYCDTPRSICYEKCENNFNSCTMTSSIAYVFLNSGSSSGVDKEVNETEGSSTEVNDFLYYSDFIQDAPMVGSQYIRIKGNLKDSTDIDNYYIEFEAKSEPGNFPFKVENGGVRCSIYRANSSSSYSNYNPDYITDPTLKDPANDTTFFTYLGEIDTSTQYIYELTSKPTRDILIYFHCKLASGMSSGDYTIYLDAQANSYTSRRISSELFLFTLNSCKGSRTFCRKKCRTNNPL